MRVKKKKKGEGGNESDLGVPEKRVNSFGKGKKEGTSGGQTSGGQDEGGRFHEQPLPGGNRKKKGEISGGPQ